jgi:hypothetical protein
MKEAVVNKSEREREGSTICNLLILYASGSTISKSKPDRTTGSSCGENICSNKDSVQ